MLTLEVTYSDGTSERIEISDNHTIGEFASIHGFDMRGYFAGAKSVEILRYLP